MKTNAALLRSAIVVIACIAVPKLSAQLSGIAGQYGAFGGSTVTSTGPSLIVGGLGVSPGSSITGFAVVDGGPGLFSGTLSQGNATAAQAHTDIISSYAGLAALSSNVDLSGQDLGGLTLTPGVYRFSSSAQLTGTLTLDAQNDANARFVFQIGSTLTTASSSQVALLNLNTVSVSGPQAGVYWQIGDSATLGTGTAFAGNILASTSITLNTGASIDFGRALAITGAVTMDSNRVDAIDTAGGYHSLALIPVPEPATYGIVGSTILLFAVHRTRHQRRTLPAELR